MQSAGKLAMHCSRVRQEKRGPSVADERFVVPALFLKRIPEVVMSVGAIRRRVQSTTEELLCHLVFAPPAGDDPKIICCQAVTRIGVKHSAKQNFGFFRPPCFVTPQCLGKRRLSRGRALTTNCSRAVLFGMTR